MTLLIVIGIGIGAALVGMFLFLNSLGGKATQAEIDRLCAEVRAGKAKDRWQ